MSEAVMLAYSGPWHTMRLGPFSVYTAGIGNFVINAV